MRKLQVFVSSTYEDMKAERQAAVEAVLEAGHIPAGMELFSSGDESQLETVKRWIDDSDVYLLLLGGRYGSIEPKSGKSYIHVEYEYASQQLKPAFAIVIKEQALEEKVRSEGTKVLETTSPQQLKEFKELVLAKTIKFFTDTKDIKIAILQKLAELARRSDLIGWVRGDEAKSNDKLVLEIAALSEENRQLRSRIENIPAGSSTKEFTFELPKDLTDNDIIAVLRTALKQMPYEKRYSVIFFEHVDRALALPLGTSKRLLQKAAEGAYDIAMLTENTITFREFSRRAQTTRREI